MSGRTEASWRHRFRLGAGCVLLASGLCGFFHSLDAARAQWLYLRGKYGLFSGTVLEIPAVVSARKAVELSRKGMELYPYNYYLPAWAAHLALEEARFARTPEEFDVASSSASWCAREAVSLNPYDSTARLAWAEALAESGKLDEALEFWNGVVEREYWNPENHNELARLLLRVGTAEARALAVKEIPLVDDNALKRRLRRIANPPKPKNHKKKK